MYLYGASEIVACNFRPKLPAPTINNIYKIYIIHVCIFVNCSGRYRSLLAKLTFYASPSSEWHSITCPLVEFQCSFLLPVVITAIYGTVLHPYVWITNMFTVRITTACISVGGGSG